MSDGVSVYECTSADEVVDLLAGGQGVFGIALGRVWREVEGSLAELPAERAEGDADGLRRHPTSCPGAAPARPASFPRHPAGGMPPAVSCCPAPWPGPRR